MCGFYCLCYKDPIRHDNMRTRFNTLGLDLVISDGVEHTDSRIADTDIRKISASEKRLWSATYGHLDMIRDFADSGKRYGFFCEYDIVVCHDFVERITPIMEEFDLLDVDLLLLGYMTTSEISENNHWTPQCKQINIPESRPYKYHYYPNDQWGVHLYMISQSGAKLILETYANGYADANINVPDRPFSPDWTISKIPRRALIYPMIAVEDGSDTMEHYNHYGQFAFHKETFIFNTRDRIFI